MTNNVALKLLAVVCALLLLLGSAQSQLSAGEINALGQILETFPALRTLPSSLLHAYPDTYGSTWDVDLSQICTVPNVWRIHGIHCSASQKIDAIVMYVPIFHILNGFRYMCSLANVSRLPLDSSTPKWGRPNATTTSLLSGLTNIRRLYVRVLGFSSFLSLTSKSRRTGGSHRLVSRAVNRARVGLWSHSWLSPR